MISFRDLLTFIRLILTDHNYHLLKTWVSKKRVKKNHSYQYIGRFDVAMYDFELVFQVVEGADYTASDLTNNGL